ncbi:MAG: OB-fold domain-containing protein [Burkholderiales bacterium]|nr:OB-fold domain-containing protein [Burkholderiales bacterium]
MHGPLPDRDPFDQPYWDAARAGSLQMQRCRSCDRFYFPPSPRCAHCASTQVAWTGLSGRGRIWSWVVFQRRYFSDMPPPYTVLRVRLDEGPFLIANLVDAGDRAPTMDAPVHVVFRPAGSLVLPQFVLD